MASTRAPSAAAKIDSLMEDASEALVSTRCFECERLCAEALALAHQSQDYERMARILMPLQEARRLKRQNAIDAGVVTRIDSYENLEPLLSGAKPIRPGFYLIEPPLVGADGRELRERANSAETPVVVVVREPVTQTGHWPIVMVGPVTVRTRVDPAPKKLTARWLLEAGEALGDAALAGISPELPAADRAEKLLAALYAVVDHEKLHQTLADACTRAAHDQLAAAERKKARQ
ncbi:MAG TPA: hypothetical protein DEB06_04110 [Phycisphaerales bacterium]|nr:hypothetical protein [Phycisphaerales bacterium]